MTLRTRRIFFYSLILAFLLLGTTAVFYAQGWRFDWTARAIQKVGGIYVRSWPADTTVYLNDKRLDRPFSIFDSGLLVSDLFPKTYALRLTRD
ncbi:MAG TPA: hypothetical protein VMC43_03660, partial [Candidatus Paceibacterota bacterium]|nr:hypothetical protein [Candidatus Paceibacterota bacterium]